MKKQSKLALIMAMLLGASTVLSACGKSSINSSSGPLTPQEEEAIANEGYKAAAQEWSKYIEYVSLDEEAKKATLATVGKKESKSYKIDTTQLDTAGKSYRLVEYDYEYKDFVTTTIVDGEEQETTEKDVLVSTKRTDTVYSSATDEVLFKTTSLSYAFNGNVIKDASKKITDQVSYTIDARNDYIVVTATKYVLKEVEAPTDGTAAEPLDPTLRSNYDTVSTYTIYDYQGNLLGKDVESYEERNDRDAGILQTVLDIGDKTYLLENGETVETFELGMEHAIPKLDKEDSYGGGISSSYAYYEQGEYEYCIVEAAPQTMVVGELALMLFPSISVAVYKDNEFVAQYETDSDAIMGYAVLPNGEFYLCEYEFLPAAAETYDIVSGVQKVDVKHTVVDVVTGATRDVDNDFVASKIYTNATPELGTLLNMTTTGTDSSLHSMKVKDGYVLAEVQKFANGSVSDSVFAVLDADSLEIVAELPKIIPNQFGYVGYMDKDHMLILARTANNKVLYYTLENATGDLELFLHNFTYIDRLEGGFRYNKTVYDYQWKELADLTDYSVEAVYGDRLLLAKTTYEEDRKIYEYAWGYIGTVREKYMEIYGNESYWNSDANDPAFIMKQFYKRTVYYNINTPNSYVNIELTDTGLAIVKEYLYPVNGEGGTQNSKLYFNSNGEELLVFDSESESITIYEEGDSSKYATYSIKKTVDTEYSFVVVTETWTLTSSSGYAQGELPTDNRDNKQYKQYYVVK